MKRNEERQSIDHNIQKLIRECLSILVASGVLAYVLLNFVVQPSNVNGVSMYPKFNTGHHLVLDILTPEIMSELNYLSQELGVISGETEAGSEFTYARGEIVAVKEIVDGETIHILKRVIGKPGDRFTMMNGNVYINGERLIENYVAQQDRRGEWDQILPKGYYVVLGDNRAFSEDTRGTYGLVHYEQIAGVPRFQYWPLDGFGFITSPEYTYGEKIDLLPLASSE